MLIPRGWQNSLSRYTLHERITPPSLVPNGHGAGQIFHQCTLRLVLLASVGFPASCWTARQCWTLSGVHDRPSWSVDALIGSHLVLLIDPQDLFHHLSICVLFVLHQPRLARLASYRCLNEGQLSVSPPCPAYLRQAPHKSTNRAKECMSSAAMAPCQTQQPLRSGLQECHVLRAGNSQSWPARGGTCQARKA